MPSADRAARPVSPPQAETLRVGEMVLAMGTPLGLAGTVTGGIGKYSKTWSGSSRTPRF